jgi:hypothetical protein
MVLMSLTIVIAIVIIESIRDIPAYTISGDIV